jgi:hypothetical protein
MENNNSPVTESVSEQKIGTHDLSIHRRVFTEALRSVGYTNETAKFELIANSLDAGATNIEIIYVEAEGKLLIIDDGKGMSKNTLFSSMSFGVDRDYDRTDTGHFGMGLKTAILNLLDTQRGLSDHEYWAEIDTFDGVEATKIVYAPFVDHLRFDVFKSNRTEIGTKITINKTQHFLVGNLKNSIATYFCKPLMSNKTQIFVSKIKDDNILRDEVFPNDPLYRDNKELNRNFTFATVVDSNDVEHQIRIDAVFLEEGKITRHSWDRNNMDKGFSLKKSGIYIVYGDQYIETGGTFGILAHHPFQNWIRMEFTVPKELTDKFPIKFNKTKNIDNLDVNLYPHLRDIITKLKEMYSWGNSLRRDLGLSVPDKEVTDEVKKHTVKINRAAQDAGFKSPKEERGPRGPYNKNEEEADQPKKARIKNKEMFDIRFQDLGDTGRFYFLTTEQGKFKMIFNTSHPFYNNIYLEMDSNGRYYMLELLTSIAQAQYTTQTDSLADVDTTIFWDDFWSEMSRKLNHLITKR